MPTIVKSASGLEFRLSVPVPVSGGTAVPATGTNRYVITRLDRRMGKGQALGPSALTERCIASSPPSINSRRAMLWALRRM